MTLTGRGWIVLALVLCIPVAVWSVSIPTADPTPRVRFAPVLEGGRCAGG